MARRPLPYADQRCDPDTPPGMSSRFVVTVEGDRDLRVVRPVGELDISTVDKLTTVVERECFSQADLVVDLGGLSFLDCAGLRILLYARALANSKGCSLRLIAGSANVHRIFRLTGLDNRFHFIPPTGFARIPRFQRRAHESPAAGSS